MEEIRLKNLRLHGALEFIATLLKQVEELKADYQELDLELFDTREDRNKAENERGYYADLLIKARARVKELAEDRDALIDSNARQSRQVTRLCQKIEALERVDFEVGRLVRGEVGSLIQFIEAEHYRHIHEHPEKDR